MEPSLTDTLCTQCGLCCDGTLFADVHLSERDADRLEILGIELDEDAYGPVVLPLPCSALRGTRCGMYAQRPRCCRTFECGLLQNVRRGAVSVGEAQRHIEETRGWVARVEADLPRPGRRDARLSLTERCAVVLAKDPGAGAAELQKREALEAAIRSLQVHLRRFLGTDAVEAG